MLGDNVITTSLSFFIADFNLFSCEFDNFVFKRLHHFIYLKTKNINCIYKTFTVPWENSKTVSFASSIVKNIVAFPALSTFAVKVCCKISLLNCSRICV